MSQLCCDAVFPPSSPVENLCRSPQVQFIDREFTFPCLVKVSSDSASCAELFDVHVLAQVLTRFDLFAKPERATMDIAREPDGAGSARRRRDRRLRAWWRREQFAIRCAVACASHHSHMRVTSVATQTDDEVLAASFAATASPAATYAATPASVATDAAPAPVFKYVAPAPVIENIAPALAAIFDAPSQQLPPVYTTATVAADVNLDIW